MAIARQYGTYAPGSRGPLEVLDGTTWRAVPKVRNVGFTATTPSDTSTEYVDEPTETRSGTSGPGSVTYDLTRAPTLRAYRLCADAFRTGAVLTFRDWGGEPVVQSGGTATLAVTAAGVGTLASASAGTGVNPAIMFTPGRLIYQTAGANAQILTIEAVTGNTALTVSRLGTVTTIAGSGQPAIVTPDNEDIDDENAATFSVSQPGTMREFTGRVTSMAAYTRGANNEGQVDQLVINVLQFPDDMIVLAPAT